MNNPKQIQQPLSPHFTHPYMGSSKKPEIQDEYSLDQIINLVNVHHNGNVYQHRQTTDKSMDNEVSVLSPKNIPSNYHPDILPLLHKDRDNKFLPPLQHGSGYIYHSGNNYTQKNMMKNTKSLNIPNNNINNNGNPNKNLLIFKPWSGNIPQLTEQTSNQFLTKQNEIGTITNDKKIEQEKNKNISVGEIKVNQPIRQEIDDEEQEEKQLVELMNKAQKQNIEQKQKQKEQEDQMDQDNDDLIKQEELKEDRVSVKKMGEFSEGYYYKFQNGKVKLIKYLLDENGFHDFSLIGSQRDRGQLDDDVNVDKNINWTIYWATTIIKPQTYSNLLPYQKVNHFPNSFHITRKDLMNKAISKMQCKYGYSNFNFLPKTYILPQEMDQLKKQFDSSPFTYIVKPHNRSQGKGITVTTSMDTILTKLQKYSSLIVSHYIDNPLLINKLKFDLRIYVAVTGINPLRIYVYDQGLARFATEEYQPYSQNQANSNIPGSNNGKFQHLTNYSINKKNLQNFVNSAQTQSEYYGSKWSLSSMKDFLSYNIGKNETNDLFLTIDDLIVKTLLSVQNTLYTSFYTSSTSTSSRFNVPFINNCFEVYGFDVMIDENLKPWLIEVNMSPSMNTDSPLDLKIKGNMISDLFTMVGMVSLRGRYIDGGWSRYQCRHYFNKNDNVDFNSNKGGVLNAVDKFILKEVEQENERSGGFRRVFPTIRNTRYKTFFEKDRYFNKLLRQKLIPNLGSNGTIGGLTGNTNVISSSIEKSLGSNNIKNFNHNNVLANYRTTTSNSNKTSSTTKYIGQAKTQKGKRNNSYNSAGINGTLKQNVFNSNVKKNNISNAYNYQNKNQYSTLDRQRKDGKGVQEEELSQDQIMKLLEIQKNSHEKEQRPLCSNKIIHNLNKKSSNDLNYARNMGNSKKNISVRINRSKKNGTAYNPIYGKPYE